MQTAECQCEKRNNSTTSTSPCVYLPKRLKPLGWHLKEIPHTHSHIQRQTKNQNLIGFEIKHWKEFIFNWIISSKNWIFFVRWNERNELIGWSASVERYLTEKRVEYNTNLFISSALVGMLKLTACVICNLYWTKRRKIEFIKALNGAHSILCSKWSIKRLYAPILNVFGLWTKMESTTCCACFGVTNLLRTNIWSDAKKAHLGLRLWNKSLSI